MLKNAAMKAHTSMRNEITIISTTYCPMVVKYTPAIPAANAMMKKKNISIIHAFFARTNQDVNPPILAMFIFELH